MEKLAAVMFTAGLFVLTLFVTALLVAFPTMWLWNWVVPSIFHLREIDFWDALGLYMLASFLLKSSSSSSSK